ncbi:DUF362 domain-containing protein [Megasphaera butyrica]|uniref:DUF362 domain-containing protein n=1 Tax=Megasphaera butyrica TaxID=2981791 RepID=UPI00082137A4|nr:DUF362 domain-containing protein [Megasphaera butyrica]MCU6715563.1 DUF362 domain-containing protein [Megasphaera butyrica]SCI14581.1 Uncharacterized Fe-S center protein [uncultured Megasphaera sp.]SCJ65224.1 Uncharacterized Fe-S center protein [uncultured Ruminococcus sp.]
MKDLSRRDFFKLAGVTAAGVALSGTGLTELLAQAPVVGAADVTGKATAGSRAKVYFTKYIDAAHLIQLYDKINEGIYGKIAVKLHTGEKHGPNILPRDMVKEFMAHIPDSTIVETNTLYAGDRYTTEGHRETLKVNGWTFCPVDIMDEFGDVNLPVRGGKHLKEVAMGGHIVNYDSMVVLTHFKGHAMGGFGGSMKNIAIGCASGQVGKRQVHGVTGTPPEDWGAWPAKEHLMELMADSAKATVDYFGKHIVFINVMRRMSVDCDCAGTSAAEPTIPDIGIVASTDILAVDQASVDLVYGLPSSQNHDLVERIESRRGLHQLQAMRDLKMGNDQYELISID